jgi:hypothetical protein
MSIRAAHGVDASALGEIQAGSREPGLEYATQRNGVRPRLGHADDLARSAICAGA